MMMPGRAVKIAHYQFCWRARSISMELMARGTSACLSISLRSLSRLHEQFRHNRDPGVPAAIFQGLVVAEAESVWMCFLSHGFP